MNVQIAIHRCMIYGALLIPVLIFDIIAFVILSIMTTNTVYLHGSQSAGCVSALQQQRPLSKTRRPYPIIPNQSKDQLCYLALSLSCSAHGLDFFLTMLTTMPPQLGYNYKIIKSYNKMY